MDKVSKGFLIARAVDFSKVHVRVSKDAKVAQVVVFNKVHVLRQALGVNLLSSEVGVNPDVQTSNGFELVRQLTMEYSLRTRSEALSFLTALAHKSFSLHANETSPSTVVTDTIRKIDYETARYSKLLGTLASSIDATGLQVAEADMVAVLLRSLPEVVRTFCLHHASGETYK
eukprot:s851_g30.t1